MAGDETPIIPESSRAPTLPDDHLALVVEDALAAVDAALNRDPTTRDPTTDEAPHLRTALLYGWATGAMGARELAARSETDLGLQHLLADQRPSFVELRRYREARRPALEAEYGMALALARAAGLTHLGRVALPKRARIGPVGTNAFVATVRKLFDDAEAADLREDHALGATVRGDELPAAIAGREPRRATFGRVATEGPTIRAPHRGLAIARGLLAAASTLVLLVGGLLLIRWVGSANAEVSYTGQSRVPVVAAPAAGAAVAPPAGAAAPSAAMPVAPATPMPSPDAELIIASQEGMRLGIMSLVDDDLQSARDFFALAVEAYPLNSAAGDRLRQVETALQIAERTSDLPRAVDDLAELRGLAPGSSSVLQAYVTALIRAGREAFATGDGAQAAAFCAEAVRWLPARPDAQSCMPGGGSLVAGATPVVTVVRTVTLLPLTPTVALVPSPTVSAPTRSPAIPAPTSVSTSEPSGSELALQIMLNGGCQPAGAGARSIQVNGTVSANGAVATGGSVQVRIADAAGRVIDTSNFPIASQSFALQRTIAGGGPHTITATAARDGYDPGEATLRISC